MIDVDNIDPDTLYVVYNLEGDTTYIRTPDGMGCYYYEDRAEAEGDVSTPKHTKHFDSFEEWEDYRYRED